MPYAINTFVPEFDSLADKAKRNTGGLAHTGTLIEQGDYPVNVIDLEAYDKMDKEMYSAYPEGYSEESNYIPSKNRGGDINEGISMCRTMHKDMIRKNSDY